MRTMLLGLVCAILLASLLSAPLSAQTTVTCDQDYTVAAGDWLSKLAEKYLGSPSAYPALATQTNLKSETDFTYATIVNPDSIQVGWKLCIPDQTAANAINGVNAPEGLDKAALENATYTSMVANAPVTLVNGRYEKQDDPTIPLKTIVVLTDQIAYGELNGVPSAAVITGETGGGSGFFYLLHVMQMQDGKPVEIANTLLGDRSPVIAILVEDDLATVDMITQGPDQPFCCGTLRVINNFNLEGSQLTLASQKELGNLGPNGETPGAPLTVSGNVVYRERIAMPEGAVVTVRVADVSLADAPAVVIGEQVITNPGNVPVKYSVVYDGTKIVPGHRYAVSARIELNGELMWISTTNIPVITDGAPTENVEILVERVGAKAPTPAPNTAALEKLRAGTWYWQGSSYTDGTKAIPVDPSGYTVTFGSDDRLSAKVDCNQAGGPYRVQGSTITVGQLISTLALCPPESLSTEFMRDLQALGEFKFDGANLVVTLKDNLGTATFSPEASTSGPAPESAQALTGIVWKWQGTTTPVEQIKPDDPNKYRVEFLADGKVQIKADCNNGSATYTTSDSSITISPIAMTKAYCGAASQDTVFVSQLQNAAIYFFADGNLMLDQKADAGTMKFSR